jgi:superfamily II DNA or RNA helicase
MLKLTTQEIQKKILLFFYKEGLELFKKGTVLKCSIVESNDNFVRLNSAVKDDKEYIQDIKITKDETLTIEGKCSCQIGYNCKHVAAVCLYYQKNLQETKFSPINFHLNSLEKKVNLNEEFYIYKLISRVIYLYQVKLLKTKVPSKGKKVKFLSHSAYLEDEKDREILPILRGINNNRDDYCVANFRGKLGNFALKTVIEFKKLYIEDKKYPVTLKKIDSLKLKFEKNEEDEYVLKVDSDKKLILSNPPFFINKEENCLEEIDIDGHKLERILMFPAITFKDIPKVANVILKHLDVELEVPKEIKTKIVEISPTPRIFLFNDSFKLDFKYDDYISSFYPRRDKKEFFEDDHRITIIRNLEKEENYKKLIEDSFGFKFDKFSNDIFVYLEKNSKKLELWNAFFNSLDKLKNDGWIVETSEDFDLVFDESSKIVLESDEKDGWFNLSFEFEFNGKKAPLAPLVSSIMNEFEDLELLPEKLFLEVDKNYFVEVDSEALKPVIKTIMALFDKKSKNDLKVSLADAVLLDEFEKLEIKGNQKIFEVAKKLKNFEGIEEVTPPKNLNANLRDYQKEGLNWLNFLWEYSFNGILADDMGLGKTIQTLSHLLRLKEEKKLKTSLVIVPTSLLANWKNEIEEFTPDLSKILLYGNDRSYVYDEMTDYDIVITTYAVLTRDIDKLKEFEFDYIILDEAQKIKNPQAKVSLSVKLLKSKHKLALSGTPIENNLGEIWSIFSFLMPGFLGSLKFFKEYFQNPIEKDKDFSKQHLLHRKLKPFILRRTKENVVKELPSKTEIIKYTQFGEKQAKLYETIRVTMEKKVKEAIAKKGLNSSHLTILDALLKLRQVCCDPRLLKLEKQINESAKLDLFLEIVDELLLENRKILVFSQFTSMLKIIEEELQKREIEYVKLTGATKNREKVINKFKNEDIQIFLISLSRPSWRTARQRARCRHPVRRWG